jgi:acetylornithine deacetylase
VADEQLAERLRGAVARRRDELVELIGALVRERSLLGGEEGAQRLIAERLSALGFSVERVPVQPPADGEDPTWGYPPGSYEGRTCVAGRVQGAAGARSLHLSGHIDVVPVESPEQWQHDPWGGEISEGRLWGRAAGDMKGGLAAYLVAAAALLEVCGQPQGDLLFSSVIEEECTGNGMKAVLASGYDADGTLIGEPSDLRLMHAGVGVIWARLAARGAGAHAAFDSGASSSERVLTAVEALRGLERALNERNGASDGLDAVFFAGHEHPFRLNVGTLAGGVWPSSEPTRAEARVRLAFGRELSPARAQQLVLDTVHASAQAVEVRFEGFRAPAYCDDLDHGLAAALRGAHSALHGSPPELLALTGTTDARSVDGPCICYGPIAGAIHGTDEWVDLDSCESLAAAVAVAIACWQAPA